MKKIATKARRPLDFYLTQRPQALRAQRTQRNKQELSGEKIGKVFCNADK